MSVSARASEREVETVTLSTENLIDIKEDIASFRDGSLDGEVSANVFSFGDLVVHDLQHADDQTRSQHPSHALTFDNSSNFDFVCSSFSLSTCACGVCDKQLASVTM